MTLLNNIITLILITLTPLLESRASIPYGILVLKMPVWLVFVVCISANILLGFLTYFFLVKFVHLLFFVKPFKRCYDWYVARVQHKIHPQVEKYGEWALIAFIGIPIPGTGVMSGALAGYLLGLSKKKLYLSLVAGAIIAGLIVTTIVLAGNGIFQVFLK